MSLYKKAPFGLTHIGNHVQRVLTNYFRDLPWCSIYVDDLQIATSGSLAHHTECVAEVIRRLTAVNLKLNASKLITAQRSIFVLGWTIVDKKLIPDPRKVSTVYKWQKPSTRKQLQRYLGFMNNFRNFIPMYACLSAPLDKLRHAKSLASVWTKQHDDCFEKIKFALANAPCLTPPDFLYRMHVATDASLSGIGEIIYFIKNDTIHYVAMASRSLSPSERNHSTTKRELLAIVYMFTKFHKWLYGIPFTLHTDHASIIWIKSQLLLNLMMLNCYETIFSYDFEIVHILGVQNIIPDALSRLFSDDEDNNNLQGDKLHIGNFGDAFEKKKKYNQTKEKRKIFSGRIVKPSPSKAAVTSRSHNNKNNSRNTDFVIRALNYSDHMTPPPEDRMSLILRTHLLGHFGIILKLH